MAQMTKELLVETCKKNGGFSQPHLNDQLFLQYKGFHRIENLEPYTDLKVLWLEQNAIEEIEGISHLSQLCSLFLQNNAIRRISDGLSGLSNLRILNLSHNFLTKLEHLRCCPLLETLQVAHCRLSSLRDIEEAAGLPNLSTLDLSFNRLERDPSVDVQDTFLVDCFSTFPALSVLYLHGNEVIRSVKDYRKKMIVGLPALQYLDERPVFAEERRTTEAWGRGGRAAEDAEREIIRDEKRAHLSSCVADMVRLREQGKEAREVREREWRALQDAKQKWSDEQRLETVRLLNELDADEFEQRAIVEQEEEVNFARAMEMSAIEAQEAEAKTKQRAAEREARALAEAELRAQDEAVASARERATAANAAVEAEREYWIKRFTEEDAAAEEELQQDFDRFLAQLTPGAPHAELLTILRGDATGNHTLTRPGMTSVADSNIHKLSTRDRNFVAAPAKAVVSVVGATPSNKSRKSDVWERYYAFESSANNKFVAAAAHRKQ